METFWAAGYLKVVAGSFLRDYPDYVAFRQLLTRPSAVFLVELLADNEVCATIGGSPERSRRRRSGATWST
jgi:hypothetical protein